MKKAQQIRDSLGSHMAASIGGLPSASSESAALGDSRFDGRVRDTSGCKIAVDRIERDPGQPRKDFDEEEMARLTDSIREFGQLQPCVVRWDANASVYRMIAGERRLRAVVRAGLRELRCVVWDEVGTMDTASVRELQTIENAIRVDVKPVEQAAAFRELMGLRGWTGKQLAERLHVHPATISKALALLGLDALTQARIDAGTLPASVGYELVQVADPVKRAGLAAAAMAGSVTRKEIRRSRKPKRARAKSKVLTWTTPGGWGVAATPPRGVTGDERDAAEELAALAEQLRGGRAAA